MLQFANKEPRGFAPIDAAALEALKAKSAANTCPIEQAREIPREWEELIAEVDRCACAVSLHAERIAAAVIQVPDNPASDRCDRAAGSELGQAVQRATRRVREIRERIERLTAYCQL